MSEWKEYKLGDIATFSQGLQVSVPQQFKSYSEGMVRFIRIVDVTQNDPNDIRYIPEPDKKYILKKGEIAMLRYANPGLVTDSFEGVIANNLFKITPKKEDIYLNKYLFYSLKQARVREYFDRNQNSTTMPAINFEQVSNLSLVFPTLNVQSAIAEILSSLDDKIEINNKINQELETLAQLLFKELFDNQEVLNNNIKPTRLRELLVIKNGFAFKGMDFIADGVPVIKIKNVKAGKVNFNNLSFVSSEVATKAKKHKIKKFDLLITMSGNRIDGSIDTWVGKVAMFPKEGEFLLNQRVSILEVKDEKLKYFLLQLLSSEDFQNYFISNATSSGGQANISPDLIYNTEVVLPPIESLNKFYESSNIIHSVIFNNMAENEKLVELRDILLPKLISGELQIKEN
jgi:type I restriction enzyme S subunit